ncbi:MAG: 3-dehydroquinate synthase [Dehalococcoidales bacterium]|nr:3-dehydroquinate synthase [Dehalococcoidales bacterium]
MHELVLKYPVASSCRIVTGNGVLDHFARFAGESMLMQTAVIITDSNVGSLYAGQVAGNLATAGISAEIITLPAGENSKNLESVTAVYRKLAELHADRGTEIIALGGGVIGDLAAFTASTYLRGLPLLHIPTSLLAQVDSSIGGKTGVNFDGLKNQIGTYYHAHLVVSDTAVLSTLPKIEYINGIAEIIKSASIADGELFSLLEGNIEAVLNRKKELLEEIIFRTIKIKGQLATGDERDASSRRLLNFGHTIGHGIESATGLSVRHGQAIAVGMIAAARIARKLEFLGSNDLSRLKNLVSRAGLPLRIEGLNPEAVIDAIRYDKKIINGQVNFVLIKDLGNSFVSQEVTPEMIKTALLEENE